MNPIFLLRSRTGLTQTAFAGRVGTSQPTIAMYESGIKSPTVSTLQKAASSFGLELIVGYTPHLTREDHRSLAYHEAMAGILERDPVATIQRAKRLLRRMAKNHPRAKPLFARWRAWLDLPTEELIARMLDPSILSREMRQVTPFAGLLSPKERVQILRKFRKGYHV